MPNKPAKAGVIGFPVVHSLSPKIHRYWLEKYALSGEYDHYEVTRENLSDFIRSMPQNGFIGANVTVPHKEAVMELMDRVSEEAQIIGAVNTIVNDNGKLEGRNTDAFGFIENLRQALPKFDFKKGPALVIGAGGAARAVIVGLRDAGVPEIRLVNRTKERAEALKKTIPSATIAVYDWQKVESLLADTHLLVNTTTLGMQGQPPLELSLHNLPETACVNDIVYKPLQTMLLKQAAGQGNKTVDGLGMLLYQAVAGFEAWFGVKPEVTEELRRHVLSS